MRAGALIAVRAAAAPASVSVPTLLAHLPAWKGRQVTVRGWAHGCAASSPNLQGRCYLTPAASWHQGRDRLRLDGFPRLAGGQGVVTQVVVRGLVEEDRCGAGDICLDGEPDLRVVAVEPVGRRRS